MNEMRKQQFAEAHTWVRAELDRCVNFWLKNGIDPEFGGVYTCLDRTGKIYSTDKSVWMQGRCGWIFAHLCTVYGTKPEWLDASRSCLDFMERHCFNHAAGDRMYFTVTKDGQPLRQRRYCFSEAFCAMANAEYYAVTGDESRLAARGRWQTSIGISTTAWKTRSAWDPKPFPKRAAAAPSAFR